ncbi:glycosyltransferase family 4 protein [Streptococcus pyogenes]|uniref:glycosyltransferase family 4 protein n=1 Tax=Streptococcus pyogenes TaxID=1314 RepID=UPI003DA0C54F
MTERILIVHNAYQQFGGEDAVVEDEVALLRQKGHKVHVYRRSNDEVALHSASSLAATSVWSSRTVGEIQELVRSFRPALMHVHNTLPLVSPSVYWAADRASVPVVQTLHNFRLICLNGLLLRQGNICEACIGGTPFRGVANACYRGSRLASSAVAVMLHAHRMVGTYSSKISRYIALTEFSKRKLIEGGLPAEKLVVKPNFVANPPPDEGGRESFLYVGRLSQEKGAQVLADAIRGMPDCHVKVIGDGPELQALKESGGECLGRVSQSAVRTYMTRAQALVVPSICYENFPRAIVEAFSCGLPVIASRLGAMQELVREGETGMLFNPGEAADLRRCLREAKRDPVRFREMGAKARAEYEQKYTPDHNYRQLIDIYRDAAMDGGALA